MVYFSFEYEAAHMISLTLTGELSLRTLFTGTGPSRAVVSAD